MFRTEPAPAITGMDTHPYLAVITLDPVMYGQFRDLTDDRQEVAVISIDRSTPESWRLFVACASPAVADRLESGW